MNFFSSLIGPTQPFLWNYEADINFLLFLTLLVVEMAHTPLRKRCHSAKVTYLQTFGMAPVMEPVEMLRLLIADSHSFCHVLQYKIDICKTCKQTKGRALLILRI